MNRDDSMFPLGERFFLQFWVLKFIGLIGLVLSFIFLGNSQVFVWIEGVLAVLLFTILVSKIPELPKEPWVSEEYYEEYKIGREWFFLVYITSFLLALAGAWFGWKYGNVTIWLPVTHLVLVLARMWALWKYPDSPIPPPDDYDQGYGHW